jgi:hypothetical protein
MGNKDSRAVAQVTETSSVAGEQALVCAGGDKTKERIPCNSFEKWYCTDNSFLVYPELYSVIASAFSTTDKLEKVAAVLP